ncbi:MAG: GNAT family N-acetyltransferase [Bacteroidia bacterium]|nr:GNAT family N-acetyltransferase [Bacteroidia bacterium]NND24502.1 GNAT family N-acetyltransferase [Flavobacteriaceae bacterium]
MNSKFVVNVPNDIYLKIRYFNTDDIDTLDEGHRHLRLVKEGIPQCYIGEMADHTPCYRQWLIGFEQNEQLKNYFGDLFPSLKKGEALVEGIFTKPEFRGKGIMPYALDLVNKEAMKLGYSKILVYVDRSNIPSLKGCYRAGFIPFQTRYETWFLFRRTTSFRPISKSFKSTFFKLVNS